MLRSFSWERRHLAGLPPGMVALPVRNISYIDNCLCPGGALSFAQCVSDGMKECRRQVVLYTELKIFCKIDGVG
jgi:hypothetical protein